MAWLIEPIAVEAGAPSPMPARGPFSLLIPARFAMVFLLKRIAAVKSDISRINTNCVPRLGLPQDPQNSLFTVSLGSSV